MTIHFIIIIIHLHLHKQTTSQQQILPYSLLIRINIIMLCIAHAATTIKDTVTTDVVVKIHLHQIRIMTTIAIATTLHLAAKVWRSTCSHHRHRLHHQLHQ